MKMQICEKKLDKKDYYCDKCDNNKNWNKCIFLIKDKCEAIAKFKEVKDILILRIHLMFLAYVMLIVLLGTLFALDKLGILMYNITGYLILFLSYNLMFISMLGIAFHSELKSVKLDLVHHDRKRVVVNETQYLTKESELLRKYNDVSDDVISKISWTTMFFNIISISIMVMTKFLSKTTVYYILAITSVLVVINIIIYFEELSKLIGVYHNLRKVKRQK